MNTNIDKTVLVTGGAGFIAVHCILHLLQAGYRVRATLRSLNRDAEVRAMLKEGGIEAKHPPIKNQRPWQNLPPGNL